MIRDQLLSKNGTATLILSREFLKYREGERIMTITEFAAKMNLARGTVQNALKNLISSGAIQISSKGHLGSYLEKKDTAILMEYAGIDNLVGTMPLPYSRRYEGLASGIIVSSESQSAVLVNLAYMRGAKNRMSMVESGRYDFAIVSKFAAETYIGEGRPLKILIDFGPVSYLNRHVLMLHDESKEGIEDGMKVGVDESSLDQKELTRVVCVGKKVEYVPIEYTRSLESIKNGEVDAMVMNIDEVLDKKLDIHYVPIDDYDSGNTAAVIVIDENKEEIGALLNEVIDVETVLAVQKRVLEGEMIPRY